MRHAPPPNFPSDFCDSDALLWMGGDKGDLRNEMVDRDILQGDKVISDLKIERFIGKNLNAVLIQIFSTFMAYLLIALLKTFYNLNSV